MAGNHSAALLIITIIIIVLNEQFAANFKRIQFTMSALCCLPTFNIIDAYRRSDGNGDDSLIQKHIYINIPLATIFVHIFLIALNFIFIRVQKSHSSTISISCEPINFRTIENDILRMVCANGKTSAKLMKENGERIYWEKKNEKQKTQEAQQQPN